jgi:signal transduction histidine kinase
VGASAPVIFCSTAEPKVIEHGVLLVAVFTRELKISVQLTDKPFTRFPDQADRRLEIHKLLWDLKADRHLEVAIGTSAQWAVLGFLPGSLEVSGSPGDWCYRDGDLCDEIAEAANYDLFGISAASELNPSVGFQFGNDRCLESGLVLALMEHDLRIGSSMEHGLKPISGVPTLRVDELGDGVPSPDGNAGFILKKVDGKAAAEAIKTRHPFGVRRGGRFEINVPFPTAHPDHVRFKSKLRQGDILVPMQASSEDMEGACVKAMSDALDQAHIDRSKPSEAALLLDFAGASRDRYYRDHGKSWGEVVSKVAALFPEVPFVGALCAGQFVEHRRNSYPANAFSVWCAVISKGRNFRGQNRAALRKIQEAARELLTCRTPDDVMLAALEGAVLAGAVGGCIGRMDTGTGRILGKEGKAYPESGAAQDWELARKALDFEAPLLSGGNDERLPYDAAPWAVRALPSDAPTYLTRERLDDNILGIIARTKYALFLPTPKTLLQYRREDTVQSARIEAQLAIPLIGLGGRVIGTLQFGFAHGVQIDDELFQYWIGFANKVAASLERADEIAQREVLTNLAALGKTYSQKLIGPDESKESDPADILTDCIYDLQRSIGADYLHARVKFGRQEYYSLVAPADEVGRRHLDVRRTLGEGQGSCTKEFLDDPTGFFVNNGGNPAISESDRDKWEKLGGNFPSFPSFGVVPLTRSSQTVGALVAESRGGYFFTEHRRSILREAAKVLEQVLLQVEAKRQRTRLHQLRDKIMQLLIDVLEPDANWDAVLSELQRQFCVDHAAISVDYHAPPEVHALSDFPDELREMLVLKAHPLIEIEVLNEGRGIRTPLLSPRNDPRGVLWLQNKNATAKDYYSFEDPEEKDAVMEVARYVASSIGYRTNMQRLDEFSKKLTIQTRLAAGGLFAATVMHDLGTPLVNILNSVDWLRRDSEISSEATRCEEYDLIERNANAAYVLIQRVSAMQTMSRAVYPVDLPVRLAEDYVNRENKYPLTPFSVTNCVKSHVSIELWPVVSALLNLMDNALDAASKDGGKVTVETREDADHKLVEILIHNSGKVYYEHEITRFCSRGQTDKTDRPHLGLGLNVAIRAFEESNGRCALERGVPDGVLAVCSLPIVTSGVALSSAYDHKGVSRAQIE